MRPLGPVNRGRARPLVGAADFRNTASNNGYLTFSSSADFNVGGNFTFEMWVYWITGACDLFSIVQNDTAMPVFYVNAGGNVGCADSDTTWYTGVDALSASTWCHLAFIGVSGAGTMRAFINGVKDSAGAQARPADINAPSGSRVGKSTGGSAQSSVVAYMDEFRISTTQEYAVGGTLNTNFTPPTVPLTVTANTTMLLRMNGPDQSTTFLDSGPNARTVTANNNAKIQTAIYKF